PAPGADGEALWTVRALLAADTAWAEAGHEVAWGQIPATAPTATDATDAAVAPRREDGALVLGPGTFDPTTGALLSLGGLAVTGPRLDVWRAPTDNDNGASWQPDERYGLIWRQLGLHRLHHRVDAVEATDDALTVRTRVAPAATDVGLETVYRWTADADKLRLDVSVTPLGEWTCPLPRLGVRLGVPAALGRAEWFGGGPGEAYPDTHAASRIGRWALSVDEMQTPYV
ncbi:beta-galactosidase domain 4-containing protein, partial [Streptomyces sp. MCAF7]